MSGLDSGNSKDYSKYDRMSTESLEELLRLDAELPDGEGPDIDEILYISEVIAKREKEHPTGRYPEIDVDAAWENFQTKYLPYMKDGRSLYDFDDEDPGHTEGKNADTDSLSPTGGKHIPLRGRRRLSRVATFAAVIAMLLGLMTATAYAMGYDLWGVIAQWTKDTFTFVSASKVNEPSDSDKDDAISDGEYADLQTALDAHGIVEPLVPNWIPDGFALDNVIVDKFTMKDAITFQANYVSGESYLTIYINKYDDTGDIDYSTWEKDDRTVAELDIGGVTYFIVENDAEPLAIWSNGQFECFISGNISTEDLTNMINSIHVRE